jgi:hypothetical protein
MLGEAMVRLSRKPDLRYSAIPTRGGSGVDHEQAIRNYLMLLTRGYGIPQLHRQVQPQLAGTMGRGMSSFNQGMAELLGGNHEGAGLALGALGNHGVNVPEPEMHMFGDDPLADLVAHLRNMHDNAQGHGMQGLGEMFHPNQFQGGLLGRAAATRAQPGFMSLTELLGRPGERGMAHTMRQIGSPVLRDFADQLEQHSNALHTTPTAQPRTLANLHDIGERMSGLPHTPTQNLGDSLSGLAGGSARRLFLHLTGHTPLGGA